MIGFQGSTFWLTCRFARPGQSESHGSLKLGGTKLSGYRLHAGCSGIVFPDDCGPSSTHDSRRDHVEHISRKTPPPRQQHPNYGLRLCWIYCCRSSVRFYETKQSLLDIYVSWNDSHRRRRRSPKQCRKCGKISLDPLTPIVALNYTL